jgi:xanthine dehydrogenase large subunit
MTRALCHFDNAYWLPDVSMHGFCGKTNTQSNTAFRGFGGPQGAIAIEIHPRLTSRARSGSIRSMCAAEPICTARDERNVTPYGQAVKTT